MSVQDNTLINVEDNVEDNDKIATICPRCKKESVVRGLDWSSLLQAIPNLEDIITSDFDDVFPTIHRICANCSFRMNMASKPLSPEQKQKRAEYNKTRNQMIKEALKVYKASTK